MVDYTIIAVSRILGTAAAQSSGFVHAYLRTDTVQVQYICGKPQTLRHLLNMSLSDAFNNPKIVCCRTLPSSLPDLPSCQRLSLQRHSIFLPSICAAFDLQLAICLLMRGMAGCRWSHSMPSTLCIILAITHANSAAILLV